MGSNVIRLVNGGRIQVRTGVLMGVGPMGPRGVQGPAGPDGPAGPTGDTGAMGQILQVQARANITSTTTLAADTDTTVAFGTVVYDDMSVCTSSTNFTLPSNGDYMFSCWVRFDLGANAGDGPRALWIQSATSGTVARTGCLAVADEATYLNIAHPWRGTAGEVINIKARSGDDVSVGISAGAITVTRVGSGPVGAVGPAGPAGPVGPAGPAGPTGADGSAGSGFAHYSDLL